MNWINELPLFKKLLTMIIIAVIFVLIVGSIGFYFNNKATANINTLYKDRLVSIKALGIYRANSNANNANMLKLILSTNSAEKAEIRSDIKSKAETNNKLLKEYEKTNMTAEEKMALADMKESVYTYRKNRDKLYNLIASGKKRAAYEYYRGDLGESYEVFLSKMVNLFDTNVATAEAVYKQANTDNNTAMAGIIITIILAISLISSIGINIANMIAKPINKIVEGLNESAGQVASASGQLSTSSHQLSSGSAEQAASLEETSSTLEESASMIRQNTENTKQAAQLAKHAKDSAQKGNSEMQQMMTSMSELKKSSDQIAKIIKVIDEIAFQTNILALNAAVEAARAGDAGQGFAVVAEEVRNLAQRSAQAAKDTTDIIESNIQLAEQGVDVSKQVNESLVEINTQNQKVSDLLDEIAAASQEQAQGIAQINKAIAQMEQVVQSNASTAEESASASEELSSQAENMKDIVNSLVAVVNGATAINEQQALLLAASRQMLQKSLSTKTNLPVYNQRTLAAIGATPKNAHVISPEDAIPLESDNHGF